MKNSNKEKDPVNGAEGEGVRRKDRRHFLAQVTGAAATLAAGALTRPPVASADAGCTPPNVPPNGRIKQATALRVKQAVQDGAAGPAKNVNNGDDCLYSVYHGGTYTKGLQHDSVGRVISYSYDSFKQAIASGEFSDFEEILMGGTRTMNGPQAGLAFDLEAKDNVQFGQPQVPPAPTAAGDQNACELLEHYWGGVCRDVSFADYGTTTGTDSAGYTSMAAAEFSSLSPSVYTGPRTTGGQVTPALLFRGGFPGETLGPYMSQFMVIPTSLGAQPITQQLTTYVPNVEYMTSFADWLTVQNGNTTGLKNQVDPVLRYLRNGRDLAAYTHVDVLYQAYFTALLVLGTIGAPLNPGNPYIGSKTENGFSTFGGPDFAATVGEIAARALNAVWYQKWFVHLRPRPEATGGQVYWVKTGSPQNTDVIPSPVVLNSVGLQQNYNKYGTWLLPQPFPEGSPTHPAYPTGHGTVGGACITVLKFFFDGNFVIPKPMVPTADGLSLLPYTGSDAGQLTVNGELNKLGHNISFGHGIHAGIHWRSDTDTSLLLGEAIALSFLQDKALTYNEPFTITLTKFDGTTATISNAGKP